VGRGCKRTNSGRHEPGWPIMSPDSRQVPLLRVPGPTQALLPRSTGSARADVPRYRPSRGTRSVDHREADFVAAGLGHSFVLTCADVAIETPQLQESIAWVLERRRATARRGCGKRNRGEARFHVRTLFKWNVTRRELAALLQDAIRQRLGSGDSLRRSDNL
jgi:hypothetical protein